MRIVTTRETLLKPLSLVANAIERRHALPILANVLLTQRAGLLTLIGTDLEVETKATMPSDDGADGDATIPARKLLDICRALPAQAKVEIRIDKDKAVIKSGRSRFTLSTMAAGDFPAIETEAWSDAYSLTQAQLRGLLERTHFCMAQQDVRYYLNGLLLEFNGKTVRAVATDGHRLALNEIELATEAGKTQQIIVPRKGVQEALRFLENTDEPVKIETGANHIRLTLPQLTFTSKLIDGRFPDYHKVVPSNQSKLIRLEREIFKSLLARVAILSNEKYRGIRLALVPGTMRVTAHNPEQEEANEELAIEYQGDEVEIGFNVAYLTDAINALNGAECELGLSDPDSSGTLSAPGDKGIYVVMPMRL